MATEVALHTLLSSVARVPQALFAHWLTADERKQPGNEKLRRYLACAKDPAMCVRAMDGLTDAASALLARIIRGEDQDTIGDIMARTAADGFAVSPDTLAELHRHGLAFIDDPAFWPGTRATWTKDHFHLGLVAVPGVRATDLPLRRGAIGLPAPVACGAAPVSSAAPSLATLLGELVNAATRGTLRITQSGAFASRMRAVFSHIAADKGLVDGGWPGHVLSFARATSLVRVDGTGCVVPTRRLSLFRQKSSAEQMQSFLDYSAHHLAEQKDLCARCGFAARRFALDTIRTILAGAPGDAWVPVPGLTATVARHAAHLFSTRSAPALCRWQASTCAAPPRRMWDALTAGIIDGWFVPAGVLESGPDGRHTSCVHVTPFGQFWLSGDPTALQGGRRSRLVVQTDLTAVLTHSGPWDRAAQILRFFATRSGDDNASTFKFDRDHVRAALRHGHGIDELIEVLDTHSAYPVPSNVRATLRDWSTVSSPAVLYRDVNLFSFTTAADREAFAATLGDPCAVRIGTHHVLSLLPEQRLLDRMQRVHAVPVDYTQPPVAGIEIFADGRVTSQALADLRVRALIEAIAVPVPEMAGRYRLSFNRATSMADPDDVYDQIIRLPGKPLPLGIRVGLLVVLGLLDQPCGSVAVIEGLSEAERRRLKPVVRWRVVIAAQAGKDTFVLKPGSADAVRAALATAQSCALVTELDPQDMPYIEPATAAR